MEKEIKRYRIRPKEYLCLSPQEAIMTGISTGEQIIEEVVLVKEFLINPLMYAVIRNLPEEKIKEIPVLERKEMLFETRREALKFIKENGGPEVFSLYAVKETKMIPRETITWEGEMEIENFMEELKKFEKDTYNNC